MMPNKITGANAGGPVSWQFGRAGPPASLSSAVRLHFAPQTPTGNERHTMKKFIPALVLAVFGFGCWFTWAILTMAPQVRRADPALPAFTNFCISLRPIVIALPIAAAMYCIWVWFRKADKVPSWIGFFAATTGVLVLVTLPAVVAAYLPLLSAVSNLASK